MLHPEGRVGAHDQYFCETFAETDAAAWLLGAVWPDIDVADLIEQPTVVKDAGDEHREDLVFRLRRGRAGVEVLALLEHQSVEDGDMDRRALLNTGRRVHGWSAAGEMPLPVVIVAWQGPGAWRSPTSIRAQAELVAAIARGRGRAAILRVLRYTRG